MFQRKHNITAFIICILGVSLNILLSLSVGALGLPLHLDTVGTVAVAVMGGYLPGVVVGFITNFVKCLTDPGSLYYGVLNVLIAIAAAGLASRGWHKKIRGLAGMIAVFTLIGGGLGTLIPWFMEGLTFDAESLSGVLYGTGFFSQGTAHILSSIIMDLPDKAITVLLAALILRIIPEKLYSYFTFTAWRQQPTEETDSKGKVKVRILSLQTKFLLVLGFSLLIVSMAAIGIGSAVYNKTVVKDHTRIAQGTARIAASVLDGDRIEEFLEKGHGAEGYDEVQHLLEEIRGSSTDIEFLYVYQIREDGCHVVFDVETQEVPAFEIGSVVPFDDELGDNVTALLRGEKIDPVITYDSYGHLLTAYEPVYDSDGRCVCYAAADVDMEKLNILKHSFHTETVTVFLTFFFLICVFVIWLADYNLILPINAIMRGMDQMSQASDTQERMDEDVKMFRLLDIHTGDEVENLYRSACRMTKNQAEHMRSIRRLSDSTAKMQDGLIITIADIVESRDSDTGAHVQKTAAYVKIIVEGLRKKGYYAEKINAKFISDVVRSAPLHDVGKINIPDEVLNKPGKLTDEEYEIMKTHTTAGKKIMENAISTVEGDNYLKEARNMAAYHHERWDGKGYPEGIHGEVIPLSARIMAVADVFDALTSPRVYKPAFPLEKALSIIEEGKGTQFDPKCVEVFMDSLDEVKVILQKYNRDM
ncbi:MAG: HD domain-containing protein [Lachnospiraceae bacterium]|nr:HD domain-containing protein [Lachnospiraceae bacterium]